MLIEFSVENFLSIKEKQTLSLLQTKKNSLATNWTVANLSSGKTLNVLNSAVIYGANASGKSNLLSAFQVMSNIIDKSANYQPSQGVKGIEPFLLSDKTAKQPTELTMSFIDDSIIYVYGFSATQEKIVDEWLYQYPKGRQQTLIERKNTNDWGRMSALKGNKKLWQKSTKDNSLFLSTAVQLNSEQLRFNFRLQGISSEFDSVVYTHKQTEHKKEEVLRFLKTADIGIDNFNSYEKAVSDSNIPDRIKDVLLKEGEDLSKLKIVEVKTQHKTTDGKLVEFELEEESSGTQKIFALAGPWLDVLEKGYALVFDELQNSLHPKLVKRLVQMFHNPNLNKKGAQLIFATHETSLLEQNIFGRDQIWFCEKDEQKATQLIPLADFKVRKGVDNMEKAYLSGRYGAVPYLVD